MRTRALLLAPLVVAACAGDDPVPEDTLLEPPPAGEGQQLAIDVHLGAGEETQQCQYIVVDDALEIARFEHVYSAGSHHLLLYQTTLDPADAPTEPFDCSTAQLTELGVRGIAYGGQSPTGELAYPDGVALKVPARSVLLIQSHYLNASAAELDAQVRLNLWYTTAPATQEAGTLFFYDWAIVVPEGGTATARMHCAIPEDIHLVFGVSHMHRRGVGYEATLGDDVLYVTDQWEGVEPDRYAPEKAVPAGSVIDYHCDFEGEPDRTIIEGPSADANEMCMFIASYYPRLDPATELCAGPSSGPIFAGSQTCAETVSCVRGAADDVAREQCLVDTCEASSEPASALMMCMFYSCSEECDQLGNACDSCVLERCYQPFEACQQAAC